VDAPAHKKTAGPFGPAVSIASSQSFRYLAILSAYLQHVQPAQVQLAPHEQLAPHGQVQAVFPLQQLSFAGCEVEAAKLPAASAATKAAEAINLVNMKNTPVRNRNLKLKPNTNEKTSFASNSIQPRAMEYSEGNIRRECGDLGRPFEPITFRPDKNRRDNRKLRQIQIDLRGGRRTIGRARIAASAQARRIAAMVLRLLRTTRTRRARRFAS
jgi:hypothetical protein